MHVVYLSYDGLTDPLGQSQILPYLIGLTQKGHRFSIISFEKESVFEKQFSEISAICSAHDIRWFPLKYTKRPPVLSTVFDLWRMKRTLVRLFKNDPFELIHCRSYLSALIGMEFSKKHALKWIFDMRGFWADERVEGKIWSLESRVYSTIYRYFKLKEIALLQHADATVSLTHAAKNHIEQAPEFKNRKGGIHVVPCCVDLERFNTNGSFTFSTDEINKQLNIESETFVVGYLGSLGTWYLLPEMLQLFKRIRLQEPSAVFCFVTNEPVESIAGEAEKANIPMDQIRVLSVTQKLVPNYIARFNCSPFFILPSFSKMASSPVKQGELMAMGIPIICNDGVGDTSEIVQKYRAGQVIDLKDGCDNFQPDLSSFDRSEAIAGAHAYFNLENGVNTYDEIYRLLVTNP